MYLVTDLEFLIHTFNLGCSGFLYYSNLDTLLECEVQWALGSITTNKASGGDGIPAELFQILKDDAVKVLHSTCQQIWKTQHWPQDWKRSVILIPKKGNAKQCSNYQHLLYHRKSERVPEKTSISALLIMPKPLTVWITRNCGKF